MIIICLILSFLNQIFLQFNYEETKERAISMAKDYKEGDEVELLELFQECKLINTELLEFLKLDLGCNLLVPSFCFVYFDDY